MQNQLADALATLASIMDGPKGAQLRPIVVEQKEEQITQLMFKDVINARFMGI